MIPAFLAHFSIDNQVGFSGWRTLSQKRIDSFAEATEDFQFIHTDPNRASRETAFGGTIAHGFLTLSLLSSLAGDVIPQTENLKSVMLVAIDKVKFLNPVPSGRRVRGAFTLKRSHPLSADRVWIQVHVSVEVDQEIKPALTCDVSWIVELTAPSSIA